MFTCFSSCDVDTDLVVKPGGVEVPSYLKEDANVPDIFVMADAAMSSRSVASVSPRPSQSDAATFRVALRRSEATQRWGITLDFGLDQVAFVCAVDTQGTSPVALHNAEADSKQRLEMGDYIVSINGLAPIPSNVNAVCTQLLEQDAVDLEVVRPITFEVSLTRAGKSLGIDVDVRAHSMALYISYIDEGVMRSQAPEVQIGDRILSHGQGSIESLLEILKGNTHDPICLKISRPSGNGPHEQMVEVL